MNKVSEELRYKIQHMVKVSSTAYLTEDAQSQKNATLLAYTILAMFASQHLATPYLHPAEIHVLPVLATLK